MTDSFFTRIDKIEIFDLQLIFGEKDRWLKIVGKGFLDEIVKQLDDLVDENYNKKPEVPKKKINS